jgi:ectoine hydroxylase-related dioxygenase (phytanoyl-CoA dioxygenase family)
VTAWVPFADSTVASGALGYVPGSHTLGLRRFVNIFGGEPEDLLSRPELAGRAPRFLEVPAGSVAFHHGLTAHLAGPNTTDRPRVVHTVIYFADGCTRRPGRQHPAVDRARIADGAPIASDVTPVAWPRPDGDLPPRPAEPWPATPGWPAGIVPRPA